MYKRQVFGGGIGLNSPLVRALSLEGLEFLGVRLAGFKNRMAIAGMDISCLLYTSSWVVVSYFLNAFIDAQYGLIPMACLLYTSRCV